MEQGWIATLAFVLMCSALVTGCLSTDYGGASDEQAVPSSTVLPSSIPTAAAKSTSIPGYPAPVVHGWYSRGGNTMLGWERINDSRLTGYMVVVSRGDPTPAYPADGYLVNVTDLGLNFTKIDETAQYTNGSFGKHLQNRTGYYFGVTAMFGPILVAGNPVHMEFRSGDPDERANPTFPTAPTPTVMPQTDQQANLAPNVSAHSKSGILYIDWTTVDGAGFAGYRVVVSKGNAYPRFPDDGSLYLIINQSQGSAFIDHYHKYQGGDFGQYLIPGQGYFFSVTAVYEDKAVPGNSIYAVVPVSGSS